MGEQEKKEGSAEIYSKVETTAELVKRLCLAESDVRIYSVNHPSTKEAIRSAYDWLIGMIERTGQVAISMIEGKVLFEGMPVDERNPVVARFAKHFNQIHVDNLFFTKGLGYEELEGFFGILGQGTKYINDHGGLLGLLKADGVTHIEIKEVSYVMVTEDEKVVSRDAQVIDGKLLKGLPADTELVEYMVSEVLRKAEERKWLINEIKNNPKKMADLISEGIELASSRAERGIKGEETIEALLENVKLVGRSLMNEETGEIKEGEEGLEEAIMTLESEVRARSKKLMSSKAAVGFINEILGVVTSFSDRVKAKRISGEFLKGERSLKQTESLLKRFTPKEESSESFLLRIRDILMERGVGEEELIKLLDGIKRKKKREKKPYFNKVILDGITKRLKGLGLEDPRLQEIVEGLTTFFDNKLRERIKELKLETQLMAEELMRRNILLEELNQGVLIWNTEGVIELINILAQEILGLARGDRVRWGLLSSLKAMEFPIPALPEELSSEKGWVEEDKKLLLSIDRAIKDEQGEVVGALLKK